jgi:23S rRNA (uridine2552-2'-O)-methyltransferase
LYSAKLTGKSGYVVGIDKQHVKIDLPKNVTVYCEDIYNTLNFFGDKDSFNIIMSDMAPDTTGSKFTDAVRSFELSSKALNMTAELLERGGNFVCKIFQGEDFEEFYKKVGLLFKQKKIFKPLSTRKASKEIYVIGLGKK